MACGTLLVTASVIALSPAPLMAPNTLPNPNPVIPERMPSLRSPVAAVVARPEPMAPAAALLKPLAKRPPSVDPLRRLVPKKDPRRGARKGRNASCWPVTGLTVNCPVGDRDAKIPTSIGFMWTNIESPYLPYLASSLATP